MDAAISRRYRWAAWSLIAVVAVFRIAYLAFWCPLDLAPDEAYYWEWSRQLDWSYHSKGPLVAWLIRASCMLLGDTMIGVRLPAVLCGSLMLLGLFTLTRDSCRDEGKALLLVVLALTLPIVSAGGVLMTIDAPFTCAWTWALVFGRRAAFEPSRSPWLAAGACIVLGTLAKATMVLWLPSFALFLFTTPTLRPLFRQAGFWLMAVVGLLGWAPVLLWNASHDWVTLKHTQSHAGLEDDPALDWLGPLRYIGVQFAVLLGFWFATWLWTMWRNPPTVDAAPESRYLWWMSAPAFCFFMLFSLKNGGGEANWPIVAYLAGAVLTVRCWPTGLALPNWRMAGVLGAAAIGLVITIGIHAPVTMQPVLMRIAAPASKDRPTPMRSVDPTCRLRGWQHLAHEVDTVRADLRARGIESELAAERWTQAGELAFYCDAQPRVYCFGAWLGDRDSQYDLWRPNPCADPEQFKGCTFVVVGTGLERLQNAFAQFEVIRTITYRTEGHPIAEWTIAVGREFRGSRNLMAVPGTIPGSKSE